MIRFCASSIQRAGDQALEQRAVEAARGAIVDVLDGGLVAQPGIAQPGAQPSVVALGRLAIEQQSSHSAWESSALRGFASSSVKARAMPARPSWCS